MVKEPHHPWRRKFCLFLAVGMSRLVIREPHHPQGKKLRLCLAVGSWRLIRELHHLQGMIRELQSTGEETPLVSDCEIAEPGGKGTIPSTEEEIPLVSGCGNVTTDGRRTALSIREETPLVSDCGIVELNVKGTASSTGEKTPPVSGCDVNEAVEVDQSLLTELFSSNIYGNESGADDWNDIILDVHRDTGVKRKNTEEVGNAAKFKKLFAEIETMRQESNSRHEQMTMQLKTMQESLNSLIKFVTQSRNEHPDFQPLIKNTDDRGMMTLGEENEQAVKIHVTKYNCLLRKNKTPALLVKALMPEVFTKSEMAVSNYGGVKNKSRSIQFS
ncbi:uncharacterized protein LOC117119758 [Anneissia japonica]|uniref:uncharacterized protein LOC117119758 n=1 Tax=Anneissia japonica TaxID=1529436 RepID=UPI0014258081|nr:uncharacterized protein LOC117119758 [Anneissia japonica]